ncbi:MAG: dihydrofolate reductase family protein [Thermomicrobiales bacterium]|nr:dihydrofolate reductase family protein [Thermomicrobiales bacterium]
MVSSIVGMMTSHDEFVADANGIAARRYTDMADLRDSAYKASAIDRADVAIEGRTIFEMSDPDSCGRICAFQPSIFIVTHHPPRTPLRQDEPLTFTFVQDGIELAGAAAGDKAVQVVGGASVIRQLRAASLVGELLLDILPVLLGDSLRRFEGLDPGLVRLRAPEALAVGARTSLRFRPGAERGAPPRERRLA